MVVEGNDAGSERKTLLWARRVWFRSRFHCLWLPSCCLLGTIALQVGSVGPWLYRSGDEAYDCVHNLNLDRRSCLPSIQVNQVGRRMHPCIICMPGFQWNCDIYVPWLFKCDWRSMELCSYLITIHYQLHIDFVNFRLMIGTLVQSVTFQIWCTGLPIPQLMANRLPVWSGSSTNLWQTDFQFDQVAAPMRDQSTHLSKNQRKNSHYFHNVSWWSQLYALNTVQTLNMEVETKATNICNQQLSTKFVQHDVTVAWPNSRYSPAMKYELLQTWINGGIWVCMYGQFQKYLNQKAL
jgi:hypothetical protein